jgi:hypothetical protein
MGTLWGRVSVQVGLLVGILQAAVAVAGTVRSDVNPQLYLGLAQMPQYASVGLIVETPTSGSGVTVASGTLIAPNVILTAGHVLDNVASMSFKIGGATYTAASWVADPDWVSGGGNLALGNDIGLVRLTMSVAGITPSVRYTGTSELGQLATFVGFGLSGTGLTGASKPFDGFKRAGTNYLDAYFHNSTIGTNTKILVSDFDSPLTTSNNYAGSAIPTRLEYLPARGDSGGGVFIETATGTQLVGVNSFGTTQNLTQGNAFYGEIAGTTRVSDFNVWIDSVLAQWNGGNSLTLPPGSPLTPNDLPLSVPEPSTAVLAGLGLIAMLLRRGAASRTARG